MPSQKCGMSGQHWMFWRQSVDRPHALVRQLLGNVACTRYHVQYVVHICLLAIQNCSSRSLPYAIYIGHIGQVLNVGNLYMSSCVRACVRACVWGRVSRAHVRVSAFVWPHLSACVRVCPLSSASVSEFVHECVHVCPHVSAFVCPRVCACVRLCPRVSAYIRVSVRLSASVSTCIYVRCVTACVGECRRVSGFVCICPLLSLWIRVCQRLSAFVPVCPCTSTCYRFWPRVRVCVCVCACVCVYMATVC